VEIILAALRLRKQQKIVALVSSCLNHRFRSLCELWTYQKLNLGLWLEMNKLSFC